LAAGAFALGRWRRGGPAARWVASGLGAGLLLAGLGLAWVMREATRTATVVDPLGDGRPAAPGEMAVFADALAARAGDARRLAFAATVNYEFGYLLVGPRLERSVEWIPPCSDSERRSPGAAGAPCATLDAALWRNRLERRGIELLIISRWGLGEGRWPAEESWAAALGWSLLVDHPSYRARVRPEFVTVDRSPRAVAVEQVPNDRGSVAESLAKE
ncbi:MAG TPA: hypothetical protein VLA66_05925, partial [Thermoanaerobaculia bacterium]|nr:hypothetical protein [Thermoanaerobaculia bacterium]